MTVAGPCDGLIIAGRRGELLTIQRQPSHFQYDKVTLSKFILPGKGINFLHYLTINCSLLSVGSHTWLTQLTVDCIQVLRVGTSYRTCLPPPQTPVAIAPNNHPPKPVAHHRPQHHKPPSPPTTRCAVSRLSSVTYVCIIPLTSKNNIREGDLETLDEERKRWFLAAVHTVISPGHWQSSISSCILQAYGIRTLPQPQQSMPQNTASHR